MEMSVAYKMIVEINAGVTKSETNLITDEESRIAWESMEESARNYKADGIMLEVPSEWADADYALDFLDDGFSDRVKERYNSKNQVSYVSKSAEERRYTLGPMYVPDRIDAHNEWTDSLELQKSVWDYVRSGDRRIRLQHDKEVVAGEWVEVMAWPYEVSVPMQKADGSSAKMTFPQDTVFLGVIWEPWAWEMVKAGKLRGYSVGGRAQRLEVDLPVSKDAMPVDGPTSESVHEDTLMPSKRQKKKKDESEKSD
jgi:hypothetical protein